MALGTRSFVKWITGIPKFPRFRFPRFLIYKVYNSILFSSSSVQYFFNLREFFDLRKNFTVPKLLYYLKTVVDSGPQILGLRLKLYNHFCNCYHCHFLLITDYILPLTIRPRFNFNNQHEKSKSTHEDGEFNGPLGVFHKRSHIKILCCKVDRLFWKFIIFWTNLRPREDAEAKGGSKFWERKNK